MTAELIDGVQMSLAVRAEVAQRTAALRAAGIQPGLAVLLVGEDSASHVYVRKKVKACEEVGVRSILEQHDASISEEALLARVKAFNQDEAIHGILVQLPLPAHIDPQTVIKAISPAKDVDGFHIVNAGALLTGTEGFSPCTPTGCMRMLDAIGYELRGKHAVVLGRSNIVGKPMAIMLLSRGATVTICHRATPDIGVVTRQADIVVAAAGKARLLRGDMIKPGAVIIDVGMNRTEAGLCGDVDFESAKAVAGWITPVPGGVGPMTIAMLLANTVTSAEQIALVQKSSTQVPAS
ncbi:bifunctional methylenetetrahydrofolate dehydrogenase/methenyltetrahydrofolate cyclohydrolase FolD [Variovorax ureilyticus]|uniref:Bifunctional protein FolD n=1 Tax=Variovorax ureilyticus TaxID=1836198 RepID=A0ABU8VPN6_9BURK